MFLHNSEVRLPVCTSFSSTLERVLQQVEYHCFADLRTQRIDPLFRELCLIISEVYIMNPDLFIKVNGSTIPLHLVQEVYSHLRNDHIQLVYSNFQDVSCKVYNKKAYLRTALYNAVFEIESHFINHGFTD